MEAINPLMYFIGSSSKPAAYNEAFSSKADDFDVKADQ